MAGLRGGAATRPSHTLTPPEGPTAHVKLAAGVAGREKVVPCDEEDAGAPLNKTLNWPIVSEMGCGGAGGMEGGREARARARAR